MLGLDIRDGKLVVDPDLLESVGRIELVGSNALDRRWDVEAHGRQATVRPSRVPR
ncbi:hypothetical protein ABGB16_14590 [Micromonospora sp. B11E3]|uniref:hypothetical protein n=1 Tax=Micromonospora sp. B11E3 TaxID=3153562 RepID=UPI00325CB128